MTRIRYAAAMALVLGTLSSAEAAIVQTTKISYFTVAGKTPAEIYRAILSRGPRVSGSKALASIGTLASQDGGTAQTGGQCRITDYVIRLNFVIQRPRIANESVLPAADRAMWRQMSNFIAVHENQHKETWLGCAAKLDRRVQALRAPDCEQLINRAEGLWRDMLASCDREQRSFDAEQARALLRQPFMKRARSAAK